MLTDQRYILQIAGSEKLAELYKIKLEKGYEVDEEFIREMLKSDYHLIRKLWVEIFTGLCKMKLEKARK